MDNRQANCDKPWVFGVTKCSGTRAARASVLSMMFVYAHRTA